MRLRRKGHFGDELFTRYIVQSHSAGALDAKTKQLIHLAVALALKCEPCVVQTLQELERLGVSRDEINETVQVAGSVGAGTILAMADRSQDAADAGYWFWRVPKGPAAKTA